MMSNPKPPHSYITLNEAFESEPLYYYNVIGVCVDFLPPARSRGTDETIKFSLSDDSWYRDGGMNVRFFHKTQEGLPAIQSTGDVLILRNLKTVTYGSTTFGISNASTFWFVLSRSSIIESTCPDGTDIKYLKSKVTYYNQPLTAAELRYAKTLASLTDPSKFSAPARATSLQVESIMRAAGGTPPARKNKWRLLKDLDVSKHNPGKFSDGQPAFADFFGEVRRIYTGGQSCVDIYLTDYTSNSKLYNYEHSDEAREGDEYGYAANPKSWQGPWGKMTIKIFLWDAHGLFVRTHVKEKMFVLVKNCHVKFDPQGSKLEAVCRGDRNNVSQINVTIFDPKEAANDDRFMSLLKRKKEYCDYAIRHSLPFEPDSQQKPTKRQMEEPDQPVKMSKAKRKKLNKLAQKQSLSKKNSSILASNEHVRCNNIEIPVTHIEKILDKDILKRTSKNGNEYHLPFQNAAYKCKVRVVDFYPDDISEFTVPCENFSKKDLPGDEDANESEVEFRDMDIETARDYENIAKWEWRFMLVLEDATSTSTQPRARIPVMVAGKGGDCLMNEDACDLEANPEVLAKVKEKLFILWGELQERKEEGSLQNADNAEQQRSQRPFECLVQEYGVPYAVPGNGPLGQSSFRRLFQLFGTTIG